MSVCIQNLQLLKLTSWTRQKLSIYTLSVNSNFFHINIGHMLLMWGTIWLFFKKQIYILCIIIMLTSRGSQLKEGHFNRFFYQREISNILLYLKWEVCTIIPKQNKHLDSVLHIEFCMTSRNWNHSRGSIYTYDLHHTTSSYIIGGRWYIYLFL